MLFYESGIFKVLFFCLGDFCKYVEVLIKKLNIETFDCQN